jgi:hypothetical protein
MHKGLAKKTGMARALRKVTSLAVALAFIMSMVICALPSTVAHAQDFYPSGSLPEVGKKINQLIYPTFGDPAIVKRGGQFTIEWDWRYSLGSIPLDALPASAAQDWSVTATTSVAANVQHYNGFSSDPKDWYSYTNTAHPYGYGTYANAVQTVINTRALKVLSVDRSATQQWPEVFGQTGFVVDKITVEVPQNVPLDLYDVKVEFKGDLPSGYDSLIPPGHEGTLKKDSQPHALNVIKDFNDNPKILQITDTHVYGQEIQNGLGLNYLSFELREPRPGTPDRVTQPLDKIIVPGYQDFPLDKDGDGKANEGAIYFQEVLQAVNLINPDFVVFTGDGVYGQKNWNTYPKDAWPWAGTTGDPGSEYRFEYPWNYDEMLALNVPMFSVPGNHDAYCWDGHQAEGGLEHDDGLEIWQDLFGPAYHSWNYGDYHFLGLNDMDWPKLDTSGDPIKKDRNGENVLGFVTNPHKWHAQLTGGGDEWGVGTAPPGSDLLWDPKDPATYTGQLAWVRDDLAANSGKKLRGVFLHHDPLYPIGSPPAMWDDASQFGLSLPSGKGEGSQSLVYLMRQDDVAFEASGHAHSDWVGSVPWYDGTGNLRAINTTSVDLGVAPEALLPAGDTTFNGFRLLNFQDGNLVSWGFPGLDNDPNSKWSVPGWAGLKVGTTTPDNTYQIYNSNRPSIQWMEQDLAPARPPIVDGEGTFSTPSAPGVIPLPLNEAGPFDDVTCKAKNTLDGSNGALLILAGCRVEFPMELKNDGSYYIVDNGTILEQYDTDAGDRMVTVLADVPGGSTTPVRVHIGGTDTSAPALDAFNINGGVPTTANLDVTLNLTAHDVGSAGLKDFRFSNDPNSWDDAAWTPFDAPTSASAPWRLAGAAGDYGAKTVYVQVRDEAMPGNVIQGEATVVYDIDGPPTGSIIINNGASQTNSRAVTLGLSAKDAAGIAGMKLGNKPDLSDGAWEPLKSSRSWTIAPDVNGTATVYVQYKDGADLLSPIYSASITYRAAAPNPPPVTNPNAVWYLAEGSTNWGFNAYISIENPNTTAVRAKITYMTSNGPVAGPTVRLPKLSQATVNPADTLGKQDFSTKVECLEGKTIAVDRTMDWATGVGNGSGVHNSIGVTAPAKKWFLPEGSAAWGFECWLLIQNPNPSPATCKVTYMIENVGPQSFMKTVPANSRATFNMKDDIGEKDASIQVECALPVIPERAMYHYSRREGHDSIGATKAAKDYYLAEGTTDWGFTTYVLVQNPNDTPTDVTVTYMTPSGPKPQAAITMPANSRKTIRVNDIPEVSKTDLSTRVHGTQPIIAERAMYWGPSDLPQAAMHDSIGLDAPHSTFYLPDGEATKPPDDTNAETFTLVQNPNDSEVKVRVSYLMPTGVGNVVFTDTVAANSRKTFNMGDKFSGGRAGVLVECLTAGKKIMVERSMYWNQRFSGTDSIGGYSD